MQRTAKEVPVGRFEKGKRLAQVLVKMKDVAGSMAEVNRVLAQNGCDIRQSVSYSLEGEEAAIFDCFVSLNTPTVSAANLVERLKRSPAVLDATAVDGMQGAIVDVLTFPVTWGGRRRIVLGQESMAKVFERLSKVFGSGSEVILFEQGKAYGTAQTMEIIQLIGDEFMDFIQRDSIRKWYEYGLMVFAAEGWGIPKVLEAKPDLSEATIAVEECFECLGRKSRVPVGNFTRGVLAGSISAVATGEPTCTETKCVAKGDRFCEFHLKTPKKA